MRIKCSNEADCLPEEKLRFLSYIDDLQSTKALNPITPERKNKEWVMDAWQDHSLLEESPEKHKYINKMLDNYQSKTFRLKKVYFISEKAQAKVSTPISQKHQKPAFSVEKENKTRSEVENSARKRLYSISKPIKRRVAVVEEESGPFKVAVGSVVYPVIREQQAQKKPLKEKSHRRIDRFHSFVARTIRR